MFKKMKLANKMAVLIALILTLIFVALIGFTIYSVGSSLYKSVASEFDALSRFGATQVQQVLDNAQKTSKSIQEYMNQAFEAEYALSWTQKQTDHRSTIFDAPLTELGSDVEKFVEQTARTTVQNDPDISGIGVFFEPFAFSSNVKSYAFYISDENVGQAVEPYGDYSLYSEEEYYAKAKSEQKMVFTGPTEYNGVQKITISSPVIFDGNFLGVVAVDIDVTNFSETTVLNESYPTMFNSIVDNRGVIVYDSQSADGVGADSFAFIPKQDEMNLIKQEMAKGQAFSADTARKGGGVLRRFYTPISAGDVVWWSLIALQTSDMNRVVTGMALFLVAISAASLVLLIVCIGVVMRRMLHPIDAVVTAAKSIAGGHFDIDIHAQTQDEIGILTDTFNSTAQTLKLVIEDISAVLTRMAGQDLDVKTSASYVGDLQAIETSIHDITGNLNDVMGRITRSAEQVASGSDQVSSGAQALSQGATEQASAIEQLSATINEISGQIKQNAANAGQASQRANDVGALMANSNQQMQEMISAMADISASSGEIGKIIKTIEDIAFQTNILALNAAVEAARAGAAGKGFAVVADEVRNLANKSQEASKNTAALIEASLRAVENGTRIADETAKSMVSAVEGAKEVAATIDRISAASNQQAQSVTQVTQGIDQISSVVQTNSATAEQSAAASEELSSQAQVLKSLTGRFKLRTDAGETGGDMTGLTDVEPLFDGQEAGFPDFSKY